MRQIRVFAHRVFPPPTPHSEGMARRPHTDAPVQPSPRVILGICAVVALVTLAAVWIYSEWEWVTTVAPALR